MTDAEPQPAPLVEVRIVFRHALDRIERHADLAVAAAHPEAVRVELVSESGGFY